MTLSFFSRACTLFYAYERYHTETGDPFLLSHLLPSFRSSFLFFTILRTSDLIRRNRLRLRENRLCPVRAVAGPRESATLRFTAPVTSPLSFTRVSEIYNNRALAHDDPDTRRFPHPRSYGVRNRKNAQGESDRRTCTYDKFARVITYVSRSLATATVDTRWRMPPGQTRRDEPFDCTT